MQKWLTFLIYCYWFLPLQYQYQGRKNWKKVVESLKLILDLLAHYNIGWTWMDPNDPGFWIGLDPRHWTLSPTPYCQKKYLLYVFFCTMNCVIIQKYKIKWYIWLQKTIIHSSQFGCGTKTVFFGCDDTSSCALVLVHTKAPPPLHYNTRHIAVLRMLIADWHNHTHTDFYKYFFLTKQLLRAQQVLPCTQNDCCCFPPVAIYQLEAFDGNSSFCWHKMIISN